MLTFLLFDVQTRMRGQIGVEFDQKSTGDVGFFPALFQNIIQVSIYERGHSFLRSNTLVFFNEGFPKGEPFSL